MIDHGPRVEDLRDALRDAVNALTAPLSDEELAEGWTDARRATALAALESLSVALAADPGARLAELDLPDTSPEDPRAAAIDAVALLGGGLDVADSVLDGVDRLLSALSADRELGATVRADLVSAASTIRDTLAAGGYLEPDHRDAWEAVLVSHGCRRHAGPARPGVPRVASLEDWPKGKTWDRVVIFDAQLAALWKWDLVTED